MKNPIVDNRLVSDITFATRLHNFLSNVDVCDQASEEEKDYLLSIASKLKKYQYNTAVDKHELIYFKNIDYNGDRD